MAGLGSKIFIAEATLHPTLVHWRVATGPGWAAVGGMPSRQSGIRGLERWEGDPDGPGIEVYDTLAKVALQLRRLEEEIHAVRSLPVE